MDPRQPESCKSLRCLPLRPPPTSLTARVERALFARRRLVLAAFALVTLTMAWLAAVLKVDAGFTKQMPLGHEYMEPSSRIATSSGGRTGW